jgi:hypothetical protein
MSGPANPYDNASCESFIKTLKREEIYANEYADLEHLRAHMEEFIERYYNQQRLHSALGYCTPDEFERKNHQRRGGRVTLSDTHVLAEKTGKSSDRDAGERDSNAVPSPDPFPAREINEMKFADAYSVASCLSNENVAGEGFKSKTAASVATANCLNDGGSLYPCVVEFVAARASRNLKELQRTPTRLQQIQFKALAIIKYQQRSTGSGTRFGTRGSEVRILSPRPFKSTR